MDHRLGHKLWKLRHGLRKMQETVLEQEFEIVRAIVATAVCILIGFATDFSMKFWNKTASKNKDVQKSLVRKGLFFMYI